jgi:hypothetical protein
VLLARVDQRKPNPPFQKEANYIKFPCQEGRGRGIFDCDHIGGRLFMKAMHKHLEIVSFLFFLIIIIIRTDPYYLGFGSRGYIAGIA